MTDDQRAVAAATLRLVAEWGLRFDDGRQARDELRAVADQVESLTEEYDLCCPLCEETTCDENCPLASHRRYAS